MNVLELIAGVFKPAANLIDELHTSEEERLAQKAKLLDAQAAIMQTAFDYENERIKTQAEIIKAEATSDSWLAKNWRPLTMLTFTGLVISYWFGYSPEGLQQATIDRLFTIVQWGITGYVGGRSAEKIAKTISEARITGK